MFIQTFDNFRALGSVSNSINFEVTAINNSSKYLGWRGVITWKYVRSGGGGTLKTYTIKQGVQKYMNLSVRTF